ncbi:5'-methylthioadenosine/adenosylhomocysteine nucleosidase [Larkinella terrae]|uniref:adenosylhomocysteine nucleosidase n=1 Tax=Larkinella terrae TaxID=2025311 RepID=A0A7K0EUX4_9BACT|nr:5'-methylthioadenosine/adenosylhomocysteine nucleosidase [Larkinella terrae]MRS65617.1 5'-methylthioadenosine/adenosylhomocysteine nucleosidase [Larkinella terrae]
MAERIIGIMGAMTEEISGVINLLSEREERTAGMRTYYSGKLNGIKTVVVFSRWGKVAAATTVSTLILEFNITELIFTGVAGAIHTDLRIGDIVIAKRLVQHDMDARPIMNQFEIPLLGKTFFESQAEPLAIAAKAVAELLENRHLYAVIDQKDLEKFGIKNPKLFVGDVASGDKFFATSPDKRDLLAKLPTIVCVEMEGAAVAQVCYEYGIPLTVIRTISDVADEQSPIEFVSFIHEIASNYSVEIIKNIYSQYEL